MTLTSSICLVGGGFSTNNLGVSALTIGTLCSMTRCIPGVEILISDYGEGPEVESMQIRIGGEELSIEKIRFRFSKNLSLRNNILRVLFIAFLWHTIPLKRLQDALLRPCKALERISNAKLVCSIAGGDSFSDIYGYRQLLYVSLPILLGIALRKPVILLPQTYGPFTGRCAKMLAKFILRRAKLIYSRDYEGLHAIKELIDSPSDQVQFAYDMGFALEPLPPEPPILNRIDKIKKSGILIGLNVSGLLYIGGYTRDNMFRLKADYAELVKTLLRELIVGKGFRVLLIPHVLGGRANPESDAIACEQIFADTKQSFGEYINYIYGNFDQHTIKYLIGQCDFLIGSRMHACIAALSQCVPAIGLAYSQKFTGVLKSLGVGDLVVDLRRMDKDAALAKVEDILARRLIIRQELHVRMPQIRESALSLFSTKALKNLMK